MQIYNVILAYSHDRSKLLFCLRSKEPYKGLFNLVGGKVEPGEDGLTAAYRELREETGISGSDITLTHVMDFVYPLSSCTLEVYAGRLRHEVALCAEVHELHWHEADGNFFDMTRYAGEGNIGHMTEQVKLRRDQVLG